MSTRQILVGTLILVTNLFLLSASTAFAQDFGNRDFDCDGDHGGADTQARYLSSDGISFVSTATEAEEPDCDCYYNNPDGVKTILDRDPIDLAEKLEQVKGKPLRGIADIHTHMFANLAYGGATLWGYPYHEDGISKALANCDRTTDFRTYNIAEIISCSLGTNLYFPWPPWHIPCYWDIHGTKLAQELWLVNIYARQREGVHDKHGWPSFVGWPKHGSANHQQMYYKWLHRAYIGGLRLLVMLAVNNETLSDALYTSRHSNVNVIQPIAPKREWEDGLSRSKFSQTTDSFAVEEQIKAAKDLERDIDLENDGKENGNGWFRIARSPSDAREIIESGAMAVVLGVEVDSLFQCKPNEDNCSVAFIKASMDYYYNELDVRHVFPMHAYNNQFGGAALYNGFMAVSNFSATDGPFEVEECGEDLDYNYSLVTAINKDETIKALQEVSRWDFGDLLFDLDNLIENEDDAWITCNKKGITDKGEILIKEMMERGMIIDVDHMSYKMRQRVFELARKHFPTPYPLVSSHSGYVELEKELNKKLRLQEIIDYECYETPERYNDYQCYETTERDLTQEEVEEISKLGGIVSLYKLSRQNNASLPNMGSSSLNYLDVYKYMIENMSGGPYHNSEYPGIAFSTDWGGGTSQVGPRDETIDPFLAEYNPEEGVYDVDGKFSLDDICTQSIEPGTYFERQKTGDRTFDFEEDGLAHVGLLPDLIRDFANILDKRNEVDSQEEAITMDPLFNSAETYIRMWERAECARLNSDGDAWGDDCDNCPEVYNDDQADYDNDQLGDVCDDCTDTDDDGYGNPGSPNPACDDDNCPDNYNPEQEDFDGDDLGDVCDDDDDGDGVLDPDDLCPETALGVKVNWDGCSGEQLIDLACLCDSDWKNHGMYVKCVVYATKEQLEAGLLSKSEKGAIVSERSESDCGKKE